MPDESISSSLSSFDSDRPDTSKVRSDLPRMLLGVEPLNIQRTLLRSSGDLCIGLSCLKTSLENW